MRHVLFLAVMLSASSIVLQATPSPAAAAGPDETQHRAMAHPIVVDLVADPPRLGQPLDVTATLLAGSGWSGIGPATLTVQAPEGVEVIGPAPGALALDEGASASFRLVPLAPGVHLVQVRAQATHAIGAVGGYRQVYLDVPSEGSGGFFVDHLPLSTVSLPAEPGLALDDPFAPAPEDAPVPPFAGRSTRPMPARDFVEEATGDEMPIEDLSHSTFTVTACWNFIDHDEVERAQRWPVLEVWDADSGFDDDRLWSGILQSGTNRNCGTSGAIPRAESDCCGRGNQDIYLRFVAWTGAAGVRDNGNNVYDAYTGITTVGTQDSWNWGTWKGPSTERYAWRGYQYANNGWEFSVAGGGGAGLPSVPQVWVKFHDGCTFYRLQDDEIHLCADGIDDKSPDDVGHEYGHFLMDKLYADSYWPSPNGAHSFCQDNQDRGLSWAEGWGDFAGPLVDRMMPSLGAGATGDSNYNRPYNGNSFSWSMESTACAGSGDDDEWNVAAAMWDLWDTTSDGQDLSSASASSIYERVNSCNDFSYHDYYNGGGSGANSPGCNWTGTGSACNFVRTASQNRIDFNAPPSASVTSQGSFTWLRTGSLAMAASFSDADFCSAGNSMEFRVSHDATCDTGDQLVTTDTASPYDGSIAVSSVTDDASVWTCAFPRDFRSESAGWARSASHVGIDDTPPSGSASVPSLSLVSYTVSWSASDATSGLSGTLALQEQPPLSTTFSTVCTQGVSGGSASGSCARAPTLSGTYCYRIVVSDAAGNSFTSDGTACTIKI